MILDLARDFYIAFRFMVIYTKSDLSHTVRRKLDSHHRHANMLRSKHSFFHGHTRKDAIIQFVSSLSFWTNTEQNPKNVLNESRPLNLYPDPKY